MKIIPNRLSDHILPFDWDVRLVWQQKAEISRRSLADFDYLLDLPLWSSIPDHGLLFDISPREVMSFPHQSPHQYLRIMSANTDFPIDLICYRGRNWVLDGVHRIAKLFLNQAPSVDARLHSESIISQITA